MQKLVSFKLLALQRIRRFLRALFPCLILLTSNTLLAKANMSLPDIKVSINVQNQTIDKILWKLHEKYDIVFAYKTKDTKGIKPITLNVESEPITNVLDILLNNTNLEYKFDKDVILIVKKKAPKKNQQKKKITIKGFVYSNEGEPVPFCNVVERKTNKGVVSGEDGAYELETSGLGAIVTFSFVGFKTQEIFVTEEEELNVILISEDFDIEEVVVTGYQTISRERASGSFGKIKQDAIQSKRSFNIVESIEGQVTGMLTSAKGELTIRGQSTIHADKTPLIVVDGFPIKRSIESINPNDIKDITILKDASAASIWGVRAANGVIVITTKRGRNIEKPISVDFSSSVSVASNPDLNDLPFASVQSFIEYEKHRVDNNFIHESVKIKIAQNQFITEYKKDKSKYNILKQTLGKYNSYKEFEDLFMRPEVKQQYSLAINGKGEKSLHRASFSYDNRGSVFNGRNTERFVTDLFESMNFTEKFKVNVGLNYVINNSLNNGVDYSDLLELPRYQRIIDSEGGYVTQPKGYSQADKDRLIAAGAPYNWDYNLKKEFDNKNNNSASKNITTTLNLQYDISSKLHAKLGYQYEAGHTKSTNLYNENTYFVRDLVNNSIDIAKNELNVPKGEIYSERNLKTYSQTLRGLLNYSGNIVNDDHYLAGVAGLEVREVGSNFSSMREYGYNSQALISTPANYEDKYTNVNGNTVSLPMGTEFKQPLNRFVSYFGNVGYTFKDKYSFSSSARLDRTNLFGKSDKYKNVWLWSVGGSWQIHKEKFFNTNLFNTLTLKATYGLNGNVDTSTSPFLTAKFGTCSTTNQLFAYIKNPANPNLRWEKTAVTNFGVDFSMLNNRLYASIEYYNKYSTDVLGKSATNSTYGFPQVYLNYASIKNSGLELRITGKILTKALKWNVTLNYSTNKNEVKEVDTPRNTAEDYLSQIVNPIVGKPLDYLYSYRWAGLSSIGTPRAYGLNNQIVDYGTDLIDPSVLIYEGTKSPKHFGSFINNFEYKSWSLSAKFIYKFGHKFRVPVIGYKNITESSAFIHEDWNNRWKKAGDENQTDVPAAPKDGVSSLDKYDEFYKNANINVESASHIRFKELLITYKLPRKILNIKNNSDIRLGIQVRNLALIKFNKSGIDPEYYTRTNHIQFAPKPEFSLTLRASF
ncbi:MAG: SusC/RagA family TonB-linked outer membrane protein [Bacteroidales bacterium]|nr:SusC/RagA family TonB-linked outer membrane protein [Bacteroidales bacterium]